MFRANSSSRLLWTVLLVIAFIVPNSFSHVPLAYASTSVASCTDLQNIQSGLSGTYVLAGDIDCSASSGWNAGAGFAPIGSPGTPFTGSLDGQGYKITGLTINRSGSTYVGIFSWIGGAGSVTNVKIVNATITGSSYTGGIVSALQGTVSEIAVTGGTITGGNYVGGVVGYLNGGTAHHSYASVTVSSSGSYAGGFVGYAETGTISDSYATSTVSASNFYPGAFVGFNFLSTLQRDYAAGSVSGTGAGGFAGLNSGTNTNCFYDNQVGPSGSDAGTGKTTAEMKTQSTFTGWTFTVAGDGTIGDWIMAGYPHLQMEYKTTITTAPELQMMAINLGAFYTISNDLDATALTNYTPIGTLSVPFTGTLEGNSHLIRNLTISQSDLQSAGLIGATSAAGTVSDVGYLSGSVTGNRFVGAIVGYNQGALSNDFANVNVTATSETPSSAEAGGLVGATDSGSITDCYATGTVSTTFDGGGLVGYNNGTLDKTYASGAVSGGTNLGGLVGRAESAAISNSFATGTVGTATSTGGLVGAMGTGASVSNGVWNSTGTPSSCYSTGNTGCTAVSSNLSYFYTTSNAPMSAWDFDTVWTDNSNDYPSLLSFGDVTPPQILSVSSDTADGYYNAGDVIDIDVTFTEAVTSTGNVTVTLETGDTDQTCTFTMSNATSGTCNYTVQAGDSSSDLSASISGTIADQNGNALTNLTARTGLAANKALVIDTTAPTVQITSTDVSDQGNTILTPRTFTATFSENMTGFDISDISAANAVVTSFSTLSPSEYTFTLSLTSSGSVSTSIAAAKTTDYAGNDNTASNSYSFTFYNQSGIAITPTHHTKKSDEGAVSTCPFTDIAGHFAEEAIAELCQKGFVQGRSVDHFEPDGTLTRVEALKMMLSALNYPLNTDLTSLQKYSDVDSGTWYAPYLSAATDSGWVVGYPDGTFKPTAPITRAEMLKLLMNCMGLEWKNPKASPFMDVTSSDWFNSTVSEAYILGLVKGRTSDHFAPNEQTTRGEAAVLIVRAMGLTDGY